MITEQSSIVHPRLAGVTVFPMGGPVHRGQAQRVLVQVEPGAEIPPHSHMVDATMIPVAGSATVLSDDEDNGRIVHPGNCVFFHAGGQHGFRAGPDGFSFVSENGGIVDSDGHWDITFS